MSPIILAGVVPTHNSLFLPAKQVGQGVLQLGIDQIDCPGAATHKIPAFGGQCTVSGTPLRCWNLSRRGVPDPGSSSNVGDQPVNQLLKQLRRFGK